MPPMLRTIFAACLPFAFQFGPCAADNVLVNWMANNAKKKMGSEPTQEAPSQFEPLKVFSVGLSRTGTMSLAEALSELGYNTWHGQMLDATYAETLAHAYKSGDSSRFLDKLASNGHNASAEFMNGPVLREALARYPDARVILTVRDSAEKFAASYVEIFQVVRHLYLLPISLILDFVGLTEPLLTMWCGNWAWLQKAGSGSPPTPTAVMEECSNSEAVYKSRFWHWLINVLDSSEAQVIMTDAYEKMNADLRKAVPQDQLLEFNVKQGYGPLCRFLGVLEGDCPSKFPHTNGAAEMRTLGRILTAVHYGWWVPILLLVLCIKWCRNPRKAQKND